MTAQAEEIRAECELPARVERMIPRVETKGINANRANRKAPTSAFSLRAYRAGESKGFYSARS